MVSVPPFPAAADFKMPAPVPAFAVDHRHQRTDQRCHDGRGYDRRRAGAAVLAAVGDHVYRDQLQRGNIQY